MNVLYAQSGGVTPVINASACGAIEAVRASDKFDTLYAGINGILGVLREEIIDTAHASPAQVRDLRQRPGGVFGSCRVKLRDPQDDPATYRRLLDVFAAHDVGVFLYNGGNDSHDTVHKIAQFAEQEGVELQCVGIPKTIDNDLPVTDFCPGFGSVAKYVAISTQEAALDVKSMCDTSTQVFILEVMGRHAGWIAAAGALARSEMIDAPDIILLPEVQFDQEKFTDRVKQAVEAKGFCVVVASEGLSVDGKLLSASGGSDAFGHAQLGGLAPTLQDIVQSNLGYKTHAAISDYLQRSARHIASEVDLRAAYDVGAAAVRFALEGKNSVMPALIRTESNSWQISPAPLASIANVERKLPAEYISEDGMGVTEQCLEYLRPLIQGEAYSAFDNGLPSYLDFPMIKVERVLPAYQQG